MARSMKNHHGGSGQALTLVLLVEGAVSTPPAEGVALRVPLTGRVKDKRQSALREKGHRAIARTRKKLYLCAIKFMDIQSHHL